MLLYLVLRLFLRFAPARRRELPWGSLTAVTVLAGWLISSLLFRWYVTSLASYESVFGNLASIIISMGYVYASALVLIIGLQLDALIRGRD